MVALRRDYPGDAARKAHIEFVSVNWNSLAKAAYEYFLKQGAGVVLVNESDFINKPKGVGVKFQIGYIAAHAPDFEKLMAEQEMGWVKSYDPERTLLVSFIREDDGISSYRIDGVGDRTPKALYDT